MATSAAMTAIDGSLLEGGGQILRMTAALGAILGKGIRVTKIRAGRDKPGLRPQHLNGLQLIRDMCSGTLTGGNVQSTEISLEPGTLHNGQFTCDTKTAGSTTLLLQISLPCLPFLRSTQLTLRGGTNADFAPQIEYSQHVLKPMLERFGFSFNLHCKKKGFFPKGGGEIIAQTDQDEPITVGIMADCTFDFKFQLRSIDLIERGKIESIAGVAWSAGEYDASYAQAMAKEARRILRRQFQDVPIDVEAKVESRQSAIGSGRGVILWANTSTGCIIAADALGGKKGTTAEELGEEAAKALIRNIEAGGCVDEHLQDQLIIFAVLAKGTSHIRCGPLTLHTETAIHMSELMTEAKINKKPQPDGTVILAIKGIGHSAS